jgi:hypothetical protein
MDDCLAQVAIDFGEKLVWFGIPIQTGDGRENANRDVCSISLNPSQMVPKRRYQSKPRDKTNITRLKRF